MKSLLKPLPQDTFIFHAGTSVNDQGKIVTSGGRVIASTAIAETLRQSVDKAYVGVNEHVSFNKNTIKDIAHRAFRDADKAASTSSGSGSGVTYADAGVSVDNGNLLVENIKAKVKSTARPGADSDIGGFGGLFDLKSWLQH